LISYESGVAISKKDKDKKSTTKSTILNDEFTNEQKFTITNPESNKIWKNDT